MPQLNLKPTHKPVKAYYESLDRFQSLGVTHETAVRSAFQSLLESCCRQFNWTLEPEKRIEIARNKSIYVDGALIDYFQLIHGWWEAKDIKDDLEKEVKQKFDRGYPKDNILFQTPQRAILWQNERQILHVRSHRGTADDAICGGEHGKSRKAEDDADVCDYRESAV